MEYMDLGVCCKCDIDMQNNLTSSESTSAYICLKRAVKINQTFSTHVTLPSLAKRRSVVHLIQNTTPKTIQVKK